MHFNSSLLFAFLASCFIADVVIAQDAASSILTGASSVASEAGAGATNLASDAGDAATSLGGAITSAVASATHAAGDDDNHTPTSTGMPLYPTGGSWPNGDAPGATSTAVPVPQSGAVPNSLPAFGLVSGLAVVLVGALQA